MTKYVTQDDLTMVLLDLGAQLAAQGTIISALIALLNRNQIAERDELVQDLELVAERLSQSDETALITEKLVPLIAAFRSGRPPEDGKSNFLRLVPSTSGAEADQDG